MGDGKYGVLLHVAMTSTKSSLGGGGGCPLVTRCFGFLGYECFLFSF